MEGLHVAIEDTIGEGIFKWVKLGRGDLYLLHFFYADDVIIFGE